MLYNGVRFSWTEGRYTGFKNGQVFKRSVKAGVHLDAQCGGVQQSCTRDAVRIRLQLTLCWAQTTQEFTIRQ